MNEIAAQKKDRSIALIERVIIDDLFYTYSYDLFTPKTAGPESGRLILLYGNNGTGKTTILNLIYHLLNPEPYGGHRSYIGRIPFKTMSVYLTNGMIVSAERPSTSNIASYKFVIRQSGGPKKLEWVYQKGKKDMRGLTGDKEELKYQELCSVLSKFDMKFHYLRDTRRVEGSSDRNRAVRERLRLRFDEGEMPLHEERDETQPQQSINRAVQWFRQQALSGTNVGYTSVNSIYRDIIKRIVTFGPIPEKMDKNVIDGLKKSLVMLNDRNLLFAKYGLTPELDTNEIIASLDVATQQHSKILKTVIEPYIGGYQARLDALQDLQKVMDSFVSLLAKFYHHKQVKVHLEKGLEIFSDKDEPLTPSVLSSGEKQLLLLLCNAISARKEGTIFVIDEPEISLNVEWQRELIPALLTCLSGTQFQIILATHSVELLSRYRDFVTPLDNLIERA